MKMKACTLKCRVMVGEEARRTQGVNYPGVKAGVKTNWMGEHFARMSRRRSAVKLAMGVQLSNCPRPVVTFGPLGGILYVLEAERS